MKYPNALWAISQRGNRYKFAAILQEIANVLGYPADWLFEEPQPPTGAIAPCSKEMAIAASAAATKERGLARTGA
jgi:hypothetical protein